jgi:hypothetical protein
MQNVVVFYRKYPKLTLCHFSVRILVNTNDGFLGEGEMVTSPPFPTLLLSNDLSDLFHGRIAIIVFVLGTVNYGRSRRR